ncbi:DNA repair protein RecN [Staphylococcus epidermidis]|jgi:DNA repair protein RecN (Recombination protein N)|uniref:DNA repair protein RecN n=7 Tax=Staphylococcus TaxID=1279 RepID=Q5HP33_STAEQ|nr:MULTISPECIES: DNA repair protein RecN [Staphylococcus]EHQ78356.1 DNA repair protein RecN [Staphylococcus epidermidis VCU057]EID35479.1 DNA repair protein RecN [Staphylococcus epidermidis IS-250]EJD80887.1 DNA repair protein RecN [Staphylococcus epidermidis NIHLM088]EON82363.1 DNA repair protein RecN [Staphylococcus epidermidis 528m]EON83475.1 DNA repair protein RecN [Staphylococcus epidermidis 41tr]ETJ11495.1 MAG: DNA repair protein RecN [Staphylococcus sp. DORA_6_22]CVX71421.1 DNA repair
MLQTLSIKQFAIIDELDINFSDGLTVMSGETGSGKSIIIDAIGQLIGMRASSDYVRHGEKKAIIEGIFDIDESKDAINILESLAIDVDEDFLLVKREIFSSGKSICRINNQTVTLQDLRKVMQELLDIHGQHETQSLLKQKYHLQLLDDYADNQYSDLLNQYQLSYNQYKNKRKELEELESADQALLQRLDLMKFQLEELTEASLKEGEVDQLESDIKRIQNSEKLNLALNNAHQVLTDESAIPDRLYELSNYLQTINDIVPEKFVRLKEDIDQFYYMLEDAKHEIYDEMANTEFDEQVLNEYESRMNLLNNLKRKYGKDITELIAYQSKLANEIDKIENYEQSTSQLREEIKTLYNEVIDIGKKLSQERRRVARELRDHIVSEIQNLQMKDANLEISFKPLDEPTIEGIEFVEFLISPNRGEPLKSLNKIASGGELSRIMLALKSIFVKSRGQTAILFDEVDSGVSGQAAQKMAEKMRDIAQYIQVICISHLPQVASMSDHHLLISKASNADRTTTQVKELKDENKIDEIARMISGASVTELTRENAKEMIKQNHNI